MSEDDGVAQPEVQVSECNPQRRLWLVRLKIVSSSVSLFLRLTASFVVAAYDGWLKRKYQSVKRFKDRVKFRFAASIPLRFSSSITELVFYSGKFESVFHVFNVNSYWQRIKWLSQREGKGSVELCLSQPEKSVNCEVLHCPEGERIRADVIFIHGLHGSVVHTWKQGLWSYRKQVKNTPLSHKRGVSAEEESVRDGESNCDKSLPACDSLRSEREGKLPGRRYVDSGEEHDPVLENITDIINNIDDKIKAAKGGSSAETEANAESYSPCWPRDWLPKDCPGVRVIAVNYTTDPFLWRPVWITKRIRSSITDRSEEMEDHLLKLGVGENPIVWVGHSKGGLFVKQMLVDANNSDDSRFKRIINQTKAIMFYSVPHRGSSLAHLNLPFLSQSIELTEVKKDCHEVLTLHRKFMKLFEENILTAEVYSFVETILTFMFIANVRVVSVDSADIGFGAFRGVNIDHREICKPLNRNCFLYTELTSLINRVV